MRRFLSRFLGLNTPSARRPCPKRSALQIEFLERRETPAVLDGGIFGGHGGVLDPGPGTMPSITFTGGVVTAIGTNSADVIRIDPYVPVATENVSVGAVPGREVGVRVRVMDTAGVPRRDASGNLLDQIFGSNDVRRIDIQAAGGDDQVINATAKPIHAMGGEGRDTLTGGPGPDVLRGDGGNDLLSGGAGNDFLRGGTGDDALHGEADDDVLHGEGDNDVLVGGTGRDNLYGGTGHDELRGQEGSDGLFGGTGQDVMSGGPGTDRFLRWARSDTQTTLTDRAKDESLTTFKGTTKQSVDKKNGLRLRYSPAEWTEQEIENVDAGLAFLHAEVGNTRLLKLKNGRDVTMLRYGLYIPYDATDGVNDKHDAAANLQGPNPQATNHGDGKISFKPRSLISRENTILNTVHELAHNWDEESPRYKQWLALSGWVKANKPKAGQVLSGDKQWVHDMSATFVHPDARFNPHEDFAETFEVYRTFKQGDLTEFEIEQFSEKLNFIGLFITSLA